MAERDYLLEIQGETTAFTGRGTSNAPVTWSQSLVESIIDVPPIQSMTINPYDGSFGNGGFSILKVEAASYIRERKTSPVTTLTADVAAADTTINVADTSAFPSTGAVWINKEARTYTGKTATTFTGCTPASYGTLADDHPQTLGSAHEETEVFGFNPFWLGRKCWVRSFDPRDPSVTKTTIAVGYIDGVKFSKAGFSLGLISVAQQLENNAVATGVRGLGTLRGSYNVEHFNFIGKVTEQTRAIYEERNPDFIIVDIDDTTNLFPYDDTAPAGSEQAVTNSWVQIDDEIFEVGRSAYPGVSMSALATGTTAGFGPYIDADNPVGWLDVGDSIQFTDSATSATIDAKVTRIDHASRRIHHDKTGFAPATGTAVVVPGTQKLSTLKRGQVGTKIAAHERGAVVEQVYVQEGNLVDDTLHLLLSGNGSGGTYDTLPSWIGAGISNDEIDLTSFQRLPLYAPIRRVVLKEPLRPKDLLKTLALVTGARIYVSYNGKITARRDFSPYPDILAAWTITKDSISEIPGWDERLNRIYNHMVWEMTEGSAIFSVERSERRYNKRKMPSPPKELFQLATDLSLASVIATSNLLRYAEPAPEIPIVIPEEETAILEPGQIVSITMAHLPDQEGGEGITAEYYEAISYTPNGSTAQARLLRLPQQGNVGLIAPAGIIESVSGNDIVLREASTTRFADTSANFSPTPVGAILGDGEGEEDVYWFLANDVLQFIDESTLGQATPTTDTRTISSVDYGTRTITLSTAPPAWLATDDIVRLDDYLTTKSAANQAKRTPFFIAWSDNTPQLPGGDDPYVWGM